MHQVSFTASARLPVGKSPPVVVPDLENHKQALRLHGHQTSDPEPARRMSFRALLKHPFQPHHESSRGLGFKESRFLRAGTLRPQILAIGLCRVQVGKLKHEGATTLYKPTKRGKRHDCYLFIHLCTYAFLRRFSSNTGFIKITGTLWYGVVVADTRSSRVSLTMSPKLSVPNATSCT